MSNFLRSANSFAKGFILFSRIGLLIKPFSNFLSFLANLGLLSSWISKNHKTAGFTDFYKPFKNYSDRLKLFDYVYETSGLDHTPVHYIEFGVASGASFKWWLEKNKNPASRFHGFDTFEGLPEDWNSYKKGAMSFNAPQLSDTRGNFYKGLFQDTLYQFLEQYRSEFGTKTNVRKVIHMDADLYSSTLFALTMLAPYLQPGDIIFFDEFNVPNHEFAAWHDFTRSFYIKHELLGGVNNYYQTAFRLV